MKPSEFFKKLSQKISELDPEKKKENIHKVKPFSIKKDFGILSTRKKNYGFDG